MTRYAKNLGGYCALATPMLVDPLQGPVGLFQLSSSPWLKTTLVTPLVSRQHEHPSKELM